MIIFYDNNEFVNNIMLRHMLQLANHEQANDSSHSEMLTHLTYKVNAISRGLIIYLTALGSWDDGYMYYQPDIKISDSHAYQLLFGIHGEEKSVLLMERRAEILSYNSLQACVKGFRNPVFKSQVLVKKSRLVSENFRKPVTARF